MISWFYHFTDSIETEAQENDSLAKLELYLDEVEKEGKVTPSLIHATRTFLKESFKPVLRLLCFRDYVHIYCGDVNENCFTESDNSSIKRDPMGPAANSKLYNSAQTIIQHTGRRFEKLDAKANSTKYLMPKETDTIANKCKVDLSKKIVKDKRDAVVEQFIMSAGKKYHVSFLRTLLVNISYLSCDTDYCFQVEQGDQCIVECLVRKHAPKSSSSGTNASPVPNYLRTRKVVLQEVPIGDETYVVVKCDCGHFTRKRCPCRHVYSIMNRPPTAADFSPECFKEYGRRYGESAVYTDKCDLVMSTIDTYGGLLIKSTLREFADKVMKVQYTNLEWYKSTHNDLGIDTNPRAGNIDATVLASAVASGANNQSTTATSVLDIMADPKKQSPYTRAIKAYEEMCGAAKSEEEVQFMIAGLNSLTAQMKGMRIGKNDPSVAGRGMASYPNVQHAKKVARRTQHGSPSKYS